MIITLDKEDACICEHEVALERAKEEQQRQWEEGAQKVAEAKWVHKEVEAKKVRREVEAEEARRTAQVEEA